MKGTWELINANEAAAHAARLARVKVIPIYPITPQTMIVEVIEEFIVKGMMNAEYMRVESEHSAMAAAIGASSAGVRTFTATASQGLLYMHEVLHWAAGSRLPIGMAVVNRAVGPPWNIHADHQDAIPQRDTGWMEFFVSSSQEALDSILIMYKVAENSKVLLPFMVCMDAFILSHTHMPVNIPDQEDVDSFLPEYRPLHWSLDPDNPVDMGNLTMPEEEYMEMRWSIERGMKNAREVFRETSDEFYRIFGRRYGMVHSYKVEDAEHIVVTSGTLASEAEVAVDNMRRNGRKVGLLKISLFRPFPQEETRTILSKARTLTVIDRSYSFGYGGPLAMEIRSVLYDLDERPKLVSYVAGLGGRDVTYKDIEKMVLHSEKEKGKRMVTYWYGLKERIRSSGFEEVI
ncbi:MAG: pyruvate ferredoxin oxidoreductase [Candidatus Methanodesulfokora sp.]|jgi:pyruvate/2-oxoacid:ferredoxin oxidoreductase alpha subunit